MSTYMYLLGWLGLVTLGAAIVDIYVSPIIHATAERLARR